jgi:hypothetical protein
MSADPLLELVDELGLEISTARAIAAGISGLRPGQMPNFDDAREGVVSFQLEHVERLVEMRDKLDALRTGATKEPARAATHD